MPLTSSSTPGSPSEERKVPVKTGRKKIFRAIFIVLLVVAIVVCWQILSYFNNSSRPFVVGRPLSNPHTHLHTIAMGNHSGVIYLGTHYGLFRSTDGGHSWPQQQGALNNTMITSIAVSPSNGNVLAVTGIPNGNGSAQMGIYFSSDGGTNWNMASPARLPSSAYPYSVVAGTANDQQFYAFYNNAGLYETRDMGVHWYSITDSSLSAMQTPHLLTDPRNPNHLLFGGDSGLYESHDDGKQWSHITAIKGSVFNIMASQTAPRIIFCSTGQGLYRWSEESSSPILLNTQPLNTSLTRLAVDASGKIVYGVAGQDVWASNDGGNTWQHHSHLDRSDITAFVLDPGHPELLYVGFYLPAKVEYSTDGGNNWRVLTD